MNRREVIGALGCVATWSSSARAQQPAKVYRLAIFSAAASPDDMRENAENPYYPPLLRELRRLGYIEGRNLVVDRRSGGGRAERYDDIAREIVRQKPDVIVGLGNLPVAALAQATRTVPIVAYAGDLVGFGYAASVARPGGNVTGLSGMPTTEVYAKYLEFLCEIKPSIKQAGLLAAEAEWARLAGYMERAAERLNVRIIGPPLQSPIDRSQYEIVIRQMVRDGADAIVAGTVAENSAFRHVVVELANAARLPAAYGFSEQAKLGGLFAYGYNQQDAAVRTAGYTDAIFKGGNPAEMPIFQQARFDLTVNLKTAKALDLTFPPALLARADEVIE